MISEIWSGVIQGSDGRLQGDTRHQENRETGRPDARRGGGDAPGAAASRALTVDQGAVQPLHVVVLREREQDLVADDGEGQQQDRARRHRQRERAQGQPGRQESQRHWGRTTRGPRGAVKGGETLTFRSKESQARISLNTRSWKTT